jgi:hypothetical protein
MKRETPVAQTNLKGYRRVSLWCNGRRVHWLVHRLVLTVFKGDCPDGCEAIHKNNIKHDNRLENLAWMTHAENMGMDKGNNHAHRGECNPNAKLTRFQVKEIRDTYEHRTSYKWGAAKLALKLGVTVAQIIRIVKKYNGGWKHI